MKKIKTTQEYFGLSVEELLEVRNNSGYTREECKLFDDGLEIVFFDNEQEMNNEKEEFNTYIQSKNYEIQATLKTINERIAVVLV